jgi:peptide-methionine (S)-S-oxide reductase
MTSSRETATLAGGCFWCLEAVFEPLQGVERVVSGYAGGAVPNPTYEQVCTGTTGHAEVVQVTFDPAVISYRELLELFFAFHDPTTPDRQGHDAGTQYRSAIFHHTPAQQAAAEAVIADLERSRTFDAPIVTQVAPLTAFYPAEAYHQGYYRGHGEQPYCRATIAPKVATLRARYAARLKGADPVEIVTWDEHTVEEINAVSKLTRASVTQSFRGDLEGEGRVEWLMFYRDDKNASFVGLQRVVGRLGGRGGSFVMRVSGEYAGGVAKGRWTVVPGSGMDGLLGIAGEGGFEAPPGKTTAITLDYRLD